MRCDAIGCGHSTSEASAAPCKTPSYSTYIPTYLLHTWISRCTVPSLAYVEIRAGSMYNYHYLMYLLIRSYSTGCESFSRPPNGRPAGLLPSFRNPVSLLVPLARTRATVKTVSTPRHTEPVMAMCRLVGVVSSLV